MLAITRKRVFLNFCRALFHAGVWEMGRSNDFYDRKWHIWIASTLLKKPG